MTIGIMQPYLLPYLGYFQLMDCVDKYVFCGDMQYIRWGWVNRNQLRIHNKKQTYFFTFPVVKDDHKKKILCWRKLCVFKMIMSHALI